MAKAEQRSQQEVEALLAKAMTEAGVAEAVEVYEKTEAVYAQISAAVPPPAIIVSNSTNVEHRRG